MTSYLQRLKCWCLPSNNPYLRVEKEDIQAIKLSEPSISPGILDSSIYSDLPSGFWGSTEEYEVQCILRRLISCTLSSQCTEMVLELKQVLELSTTGWIDRFVICSGIQVLHKLLAEIVTTGVTRDADTENRENALVHCFNILYSRSILAQELTSSVSNENVLRTFLSCLISPNEDTRILATQTVLILKAYLGSPSKILYTIKLPNNR